jgi:hypothetical protein
MFPWRSDPNLVWLKANPPDPFNAGAPHGQLGGDRHRLPDCERLQVRQGLDMKTLRPLIIALILAVAMVGSMIVYLAGYAWHSLTRKR